MIDVGVRKFLFVRVDIPPNSQAEKYILYCPSSEDIIHKFTLITKHSYLVISIFWKLHGLIMSGVMVDCFLGSSALLIAYSYGFFYLYQLNEITNSRNALLDLIFFNDNSIVVDRSLNQLFSDLIGMRQ